MKVSLKKNKKPDICVRDMDDGDIAEVVGRCNSDYLGDIIQRHGDDLVMIGGTIMKGWDNIDILSNNFRVRLLTKGDAIVIEE